MSLFARLLAFLRPEPPLPPEVRHGIERCCDVVDPLLRGLGSCERRLGPAVAAAQAYCAEVVALLPDPVPVDRHAFANDPLVHAYFATADDLHQMLGKSRALRDYLQKEGALGGDYVYAMLAARQRCKKTLGVAMEGEVVRSDVPVEYLFFSDHTLASPADSVASLRQTLRQAAFDSLLRSFRDHLDALRGEKQELRSSLDRERDQVTVLRQSPEGPTLEPVLEGHTRKIAELETRLRESMQSLQPEQIAAALGEFLKAPQQALQLNPVHITVDRSGRVLGDDVAPEPGIDRLDLWQLKARDRRNYVVFTAAIRRDEAEQAVAALEGLQLRSIVI